MEEKNTQTKTKQTKKTTQEQPKMPEFKNLNDLHVTVKTATNAELINEVGVTTSIILMQEDGKIMTSFLGNYNKEILKTLERVNRKYFKSLIKQLYKKPKPEKTAKAEKTEKETKTENKETKTKQSSKKTK